MEERSPPAIPHHLHQKLILLAEELVRWSRRAGPRLRLPPSTTSMTESHLCMQEMENMENMENFHSRTGQSGAGLGIREGIHPSIHPSARKAASRASLHPRIHPSTHVTSSFSSGRQR